MIYFDNAATGGFKPRSVIDATTYSVKYLLANPGRSGHRLSLTGAEIVFSTRERLARFFNLSPSNVVFTKNCTEALNTAILGTVKKGGHVITTVYEHNSVLRPLYQLKEKGLISLDVVNAEPSGIDKAIEEKINADTYLIVTTSVSNVTGEKLPLDKIGQTAKKHGLIYIVDGAQGGGHIPIDIKKMNVSALAVAGHKGLYGIMGSGALLLGDGIDVSPLTFGGTGTESLSTTQPLSMPEKLESGTLNLPAISALNEGVRYISENMEYFSKNLYVMTEKLIDGLNKIDGVKIYSAPNPAGIVSFNLYDEDSARIADILSKEYDIAVRSGYHCAPLIHSRLKTIGSGTVRASLSIENSSYEINCFISAVKKIARKLKPFNAFTNPF